MISADIHVVII